MDRDRHAMTEPTWPTSWAPYLTWAKHHTRARWDLTASGLAPCPIDELPGAREEMKIQVRSDDGYPPLLEAIAERYGVDTIRVATGGGAAGVNFLALAALVRPGDEVLVESPGYDPLGGAARLLGAEVRTFERSFEEAWVLDPDRIAKAITTDTRAIVVSNPHNPSGVYAEPAVLDAIAEVAASVDARVIVDEVYLEALSGVDTTPAATRSEVFVSTSSLTKCFGLAGLRLGWLLGERDVVERARRARDVVDGNGPSPSESLAVVAFRHADRLLERARSILEPNGRLLRAFVAGRSDLAWVPPAGGAVAFPRLEGVDDTSAFVQLAQDEFDVGLVAGRFFGAPRHFRVAIGGEPAMVEGGLEALGRALDAYPRS
jgi:hypothetical protein